MSKHTVLVLAAVFAGLMPALAFAGDATMPAGYSIPAPAPTLPPTDDSMLVLLDSITSQSSYQCIKVRNDTVFCAQQEGTVYYRSRLTGAVITSFPLQSGSPFIAICPVGDSLFVSRLGAPEYCEVYTLGGTYVRSFTPSGSPQVRGLEWDGTKFWSTTFSGGELYIYTMNKAGTVLKTLSRSGGIQSVLARDLVLDPMYPNRLWTSYTNTAPHSLMYVAFDTSANTFTPLVTFPTGQTYYMSGLGFRNDPVDGGCLYLSAFSGSWIWRYKVHEPVASELRVLWLYSDYGTPDTTLGIRLKALGDSIEYMDVRTTTPTIGQLLPYDAVGVNSNFGFSDPTALGNVLAQYVDSGGGVVLTNFCFTTDGNGLQGAIMSGSYATLTLGANSFTNSTLGWFNPAHPVMNGITSVGAYFRTLPTFVGDSVAKWADGRPYVAASTNQKVVGINMYPGIYPSSGRTGEWAVVIHNALEWVAGEQTYIIEEPQPVPGLTLLAGPNPASARVHISYAADVSGRQEIAVYDATGSFVRQLAAAPAGPAVRHAVWNLDDTRGQPVARGVYFCRLTAGGRTLDRKLVVTR